MDAASTVSLSQNRASASVMAASFMEAGVTLKTSTSPSFGGATVTSPTNSCSLPNANSFASLGSDHSDRFKKASSMSSTGSNSSPVIAQSLSMQFHKTRICPFFAKGHCRKGSDCTYAHASSELKTAPNLLKTKLCEEWQKGNCNDEDCRFAHGRHELRSTNLVYKTRICHFWEIGECNKGSLCRHAHGYDELRASKAEASELRAASSSSLLTKQESTESCRSTQSHIAPSWRKQNFPAKVENAGICMARSTSSKNKLNGAEYQLTLKSSGDDNWRSPNNKSDFERPIEGNVWNIPKPIDTSPLVPPSNQTDNYLTPTSATTSTGILSSKAEALSLLNEALAALNLRGNAALQAENLKALISDVVIKELGETSHASSASLTLPSFRNSSSRGKEWDCVSTDVDSIVTPNRKETPESTPHYSRKSSIYGQSANHVPASLVDLDTSNIDFMPSLGVTVSDNQNNMSVNGYPASFNSFISDALKHQGQENGTKTQFDSDFIDVALTSVLQQFLSDQAREFSKHNSDVPDSISLEAGVSSIGRNMNSEERNVTSSATASNQPPLSDSLTPDWGQVLQIFMQA